MANQTRSLARRVLELEKAKLASKQPTLGFSTIDDGTLTVVDVDGNLVGMLGKQYDGTFTQVDVNGPTPPKPSAPVATPVADGVVITWDGLYEDPSDVAPMDWVGTDIVHSIDSGFDATVVTPTNRFTSAQGGMIFVSTPYGEEHHFRLVTRTTSGKKSTPSEMVSAQSVGIIPSTDGEAPAASEAPEVRGTKSLIIAQIPGVENQSGVTYQWHITTEPDVVGLPDFDGPTKHHDGVNVMEAFDSTPNGLPLDYFTPYYIGVFTYDDDLDDVGPGDFSGWSVPVEISQTAQGDIAFEAITAAHLSAVILLASTIKTADAGRRVEISNSGIVVYDSDGSILVQFNTDPTADVPIDFRGVVKAKSITIDQGMSLNGTNNQIEREGVLTLAGKVTAPQTPPAISIAWDSIQTPLVDNSFPGLYHNGLIADGSNWATAVNWFGGAIKTWDSTGAFVSSVALPDTWVAGETTGIHFYPAGLVKISSTYYILGWEDDYGAGDSAWKVYRYSITAGVATKLGEWTYNSHPSSFYQPAIGTENSEVLIAQCDSTGDVNLHRFNPTSGAEVGSGVNTGHAVSKDLTSTLYGSFDIGGTRWIVSTADTVGKIYVYNTSGTRQTDEEWPAAAGSGITGMTYDGSNFRSRSKSGKVYTYTQNRWTTASSKWWASYTWYDSNATDSFHETEQSSRASFTMTKRAKLVVTTPAIPDLGGTNDPDTAKIFLGRGSTDPGRTAMWLNGSPSVPASPSTGVTSEIVNAAFASVDNPPSSNNFPTATPAKLALNNGGSYLKGDGKFRFGATSAEFQTGIDFGVASAATAGGGGTATFTHNLGVVPTAVFVNLNTVTGNARYYFVRTASFTSTTFQVDFRTAADAVVPNGNTQSVIYWAVA